MPHTLDRITVIDLTQNVAGPYCTQLLGDFGATVIKIERPHLGDDVRRFAPVWTGGTTEPGDSTAYLAYNRNKKSVCIDLDHAQGVEIVHRLTRTADVFVHSFRPGSAESRRLGYDDLSAINQRLIYCCISGFGERGPLRDLPGYDPLGQAHSGVISVTGHPGAPPARVVVPIVDMGSGLWLFSGILAALLERGKTGRGARVNVSLLETGVAWTTLHMSNYMATGEVPERTGSASPAAAPYEAFETADGWIMIAAGNDRLFARLCELLDIPGTARDERFRANAARVARRAELHSIIEERTRGRTTADWVDALRQAGVPCSPINRIDQVHDDEQVGATGMIKRIDDFRAPGFGIVDIAVNLNGEKAVLRSMPPRLGEHTEEILRGAGYAEGEIESLRAAGTIS
jgi:crotonobetainyl-CoA:carnitine CoA-transferase CaiB-like acyl-CoA transferase